MSPHRDADNPFEDSDHHRASDLDSRQRPKQKRRRWPWLLALLALVVFFLPNLIGWLGLQQTALNFGLSDFKGTVSVDQVSLGWLQPIKLTNVTGVDLNGNKIFEVANVTSSKPLYAFLTSKDYGQFEIQNPVAYVQLRPDGSNFEDALANYMAPSSDPNDEPTTQAATTLPKMQINMVDGQMVVTSSTDGSKYWQFDEFNAVAETSSEDAPLVIDAQFRLTEAAVDSGQGVSAPSAAQSGGVSLVSHIDSGADVLSFGSADVLMETQNLPLSLAAPMLQRFVGPANTAGLLNGKFQAAYHAGAQTVEVLVDRMNLAGFGIVAPELLGSDQFVLNNISSSGVLRVSPTKITAQQFELKSDVGHANADGTFDINQITQLASGGQLLDTPFAMDGEIDLAKLIRMLPSTLQLHQDLTVNSGTVTFQASSQNQNGTRRMVVNVDTANLNANRGGQNVVWTKPLRLVGTIQESNGKLALQNVRCESDFLTVVGNADFKTGSFVVQGDLSRLMDSVGQFVDLQGTRLAGVLDGKFGWQVESYDSQPAASQSLAGTGLPIQIVGRFTIDNPVIEMAGMPRWEQRQMSIQVSGVGSQSEDRLRLDQGGVQVDIGNEKLVAVLSQPVASAFTNEVWNANCEMTGSMAQWLSHIQNFVDLGEIAAAGQLSLTCAASVSSDNVQVSGVQYEVEQLAFNGYGIKLREAKVIGTGSAGYDLASGNIIVPEMTLAASSISARGQQLQITFPGNMRVDGNVAFKADMNRVADWFELSSTDESIFWFGAMEGTVQLSSNENGISGRLNSTVPDLIAATQSDIQGGAGQFGQTIQVAQPQKRWQEVWREPTAQIAGGMSLANDFNAVAFQNLTVNSESLKLQASGTITDLASSMVTNMTGTWNPSWQKINSLLYAFTGEALKFSGQGQQQFVVRGPIFETATQLGQPTPWVSPRLQAETSVGWEQGEVLGMPVGRSQMNIALDQGVAVVQTNGIPFAGGMVQLAPRIDMRGQQPVLTMDRTRLIDNVVLQPETAREWLKYVAPLAADATSAQGNFTVDVEGARIPLFEPMKMEVKAAVKLNNVVIGAGPAAEQLLGTVKQLRALLKPDSTDRDMNTWLQLSEQTVPVIVRDGKVFHERLKFSHKDLTVQTRGSVGFDQSLDMVADIPIADDWIAGKSYLAGLQGQSISIPVGGTVSKPVLDRRAVQQLSQNLVKQAAGNVINKAIGEKFTPKVNEFQDRLNSKFSDELNGLTDKLGFPKSPAPTSEQSPANDAQPQPDLINGLKNLFGK